LINKFALLFFSFKNFIFLGLTNLDPDPDLVKLGPYHGADTGTKGLELQQSILHVGCAVVIPVPFAIGMRKLPKLARAPLEKFSRPSARQTKIRSSL
jgi:hypothetical protein